MAISILLSTSVLSSRSAAILRASGDAITMSHSISLASLTGGMTTRHALRVSLMPKRKLSSELPRKFSRWSTGKSASALLPASGSSSAGTEKDEVNGRRFSICVPSPARGKRCFSSHSSASERRGSSRSTLGRVNDWSRGGSGASSAAAARASFSLFRTMRRLVFKTWLIACAAAAARSASRCFALPTPFSDPSASPSRLCAYRSV